ncbi:protoheme IX farnesyltransferase [Ponticoccus sp. SC2-23]|uniref:heme o synthase n=1 Tax=Alexandriicola marinus TaxID=2081710 RepID=UPI000FDC21B9|nr:heme o synthase [Alexandriicola marinus]MBM1221565.1 protoheme IX farnesyltransferase [Ponticoccus sp. SC6-9]MBM1226606.1 protoheme IX farnesyltransferase [Ponticoccus sp. SC6-15]MBM1230557.1 protoheme IX farnesyltransferase [Ponticoccus sp. SC6-38]MBM1235080.1 protoheme IX farnesyltransferase [Ponticoccus sp. SC6-45]MBM1239578.1 protoheme IX farnesyltransferase [Ponticoccus sp. SC6-49]MBM1243360.1 protoheme IX farnesyltransferase [Ponticoccus sp. SC2-64]MBM1248604.1 protoheme IX farnesyl
MTDASVTDVAHNGAQTNEAGFGDYFALLKPRVMSLVVFTALVGLVVAPVGIHPFIGFVAILCIAVGAGASGALNMWWDADIDSVMKRTSRRPIPAGKVEPSEALGIGLALSGFSVILLFLATNLLAAALLAFTIFFYAVIYSMWLKRATPQNIVIGGAAGAFPPMIGWAVATGGVSIESALMFALIFMWTPPHFWALALFVRSDYGDAGVPMLTETHGRPITRNHILVYTLFLVPVALGLGFTSIGGPVYLAAAFVLNLRFFYGAWLVWLRDDAAAEADNYATEKWLFRISLSYLFLHFGLLLVEAALHSLGWSIW